MRFARWVFTASGVYGLVAILPLYFIEAQFGRDHPPAVNHPEFYYGFAGLGLAWQLAFLLIGRDPARYRWMMLPAIVEKLSYFVAVGVLYAQGRAPGMILGFSLIDLAWGALFAAAFVRTADEAGSIRA